MPNEKVKEIIKATPSFASFTDLAAERLGGKVLYATDDFFAEKENLIEEGRGVFIADKYTDRGKWMDGWESRRKRDAGHDWCVVQLGAPGKIKGFDIDTNFFLGNHPPFASIDGLSINNAENITNWDSTTIPWKELLSHSPLDAGSQNFFACSNEEIITHVRLHIYPDGGVARLRVYGEVYKDWSEVGSNEEVDLAAAINGGKALTCNDMFFSSMNNLILPRRGMNMGDGWETKRSRIPGNKDWVILKLGTPGTINRIIVDTAYFKGNYPDSCMVEGCFAKSDEEVVAEKVAWKIMLPQQKLTADSEHEYESELINKEPISHVRLTILPDGGISRLRLFGTILR